MPPTQAMSQVLTIGSATVSGTAAWGQFQASHLGAVLAAVAMRWNNDYLSQIEAERGDKFAQLVAESHKTAIDTLEQVHT